MRGGELETVYEVDEEAFLDGAMYPASVPNERWAFACYRATIGAGLMYALAVLVSTHVWKECSKVRCVGDMYAISIVGFLVVVAGSVLFDKVVIKRIAEHYEEILERTTSAAVRKWGKIYFAASLCLWVAFSIYILRSLDSVSTAAEPMITSGTVAMEGTA